MQSLFKCLLLLFCAFMTTLFAAGQLPEPTAIYYQTGQVQPLLAHYEADRGSQHQHQHVVFPPELVARASTAAPVRARRT